MDDQLQQLIDLQREQNQLLKKYLWRFRFSLMSLLILTTITAIGLGFLVYQDQTKVVPPTPTSAGWSGFIDTIEATEMTGSPQSQGYELRSFPAAPKN